MHDPQDLAWYKALRRECTKRQLDTSLAEMRVLHGICTIDGVISAYRGGPEDPEREVIHIAQILRHQGVRDVVINCKFRK